MKLVTKVTNVFDRILDFLFVFAGVLIVFMMLSTTANVMLRLVGRPILWSLEITEYSLAFIPFLGAAWLLRKEGHVKLDLLLTRLKPGPRSLVNIFTSMLVTIAVLALTWYSALATWDSFQVSYMTAATLHFPRFSLELIIPIGSFLLFIQFLRRTYGFVKSRTKDVEESKFMESGD